jgi:hypothetical protein
MITLEKTNKLGEKAVRVPLRTPRFLSTGLGTKNEVLARTSNEFIQADQIQGSAERRWT